MLPLTSDAYTGLADKQLPEAGIGINIIENLGSSFGTAVLATIVASVTLGQQIVTVSSIRGYQIGFLVSVIVLILIIVPSLFLTHKKTVKQDD